LGHGARLLHQLRESPAAQVRRPPQSQSGDQVDAIAASKTVAGLTALFRRRPWLRPISAASVLDGCSAFERYRVGLPEEIGKLRPALDSEFAIDG
jgi:hypothetical protein